MDSIIPASSNLQLQMSLFTRSHPPTLREAVSASTFVPPGGPCRILFWGCGNLSTLSSWKHPRDSRRTTRSWQYGRRYSSCITSCRGERYRVYLIASTFAVKLVPCSRVGRELDFSRRGSYPTRGKAWGMECHGQLPRTEHAKLRSRLLRLEELHGDAIRKRFPQED